jgi:hypothetical protein
LRPTTVAFPDKLRIELQRIAAKRYLPLSRVVAGASGPDRIQ